MRDRQQRYIVVNHMFHYSLLRICIYECMYVCIRLHPIPRKCSCNPLPKVECIMNACMVGRDTMDEWMSYRTTERIKWVYVRTDYSGICCVYLLFLFRLCFVYHTFSSWVFVHSLSACISCLRRPDCLNKVQYSIGRRTSTWVVLPPNRLYIDSSCYVGNQSVIGSQRENHMDFWRISKI